MRQNSRLLGRAEAEFAFERPLAHQQEQTVDDLAMLLRERVPGAWNILFEQHFDRVYRYALAHLSDTHQAEDVAATTFERALSAIDRYSERGKPLVAWLYGIARNVVMEEYRRQSTANRRPRVISMFSMKKRATIEFEAARQASDSVDGCLDLRKALDELTGPQREVVLLRYMVGLSAAEVGRITGREVGGVYALQARALATLRRRMK